MAKTVNLRISLLIPLIFALSLAGRQSHVHGQNAEIAENLARIWIGQAKSKEGFSYPPLTWHQVRGNKGQWGWVAPNLIYERRGSETRKAVFVVDEKLSDSEAIVEVLISYYKPGWRPARGNPGRPSETIRTRRQFLFSGFDFGKTTERQQLRYKGGAIFQGDHPVTRRDGTQINLSKLAPVDVPSLPTRANQVGVGLKTWTDDTGRFAVEAIFEELRDDQVTLVTKDDRQVEVPLARLAAADQRIAVALDEVARKDRLKRLQHKTRGGNQTVSTSQRRKPSSFEKGLRAKIHAEVMRSSFGRW